MAPFKQRGSDRRVGKRRRIDRVEEREGEVRDRLEAGRVLTGREYADERAMLTTRVPQDVAAWVDRMAKADGRSASSWLRKLILDARAAAEPMPDGDPRRRLRYAVELRNGRVVSAHLEREWADAELASWMIYGPMVVDMEGKR